MKNAMCPRDLKEEQDDSGEEGEEVEWGWVLITSHTISSCHRLLAAYSASCQDDHAHIRTRNPRRAVFKFQNAVTRFTATTASDAAAPTQRHYHRRYVSIYPRMIAPSLRKKVVNDADTASVSEDHEDAMPSHPPAPTDNSTASLLPFPSSRPQSSSPPHSSSRPPAAVYSSEHLVDTRMVRPTHMRLACRVMYDGTAFKGWQFQPRARTVQGELEAALSTIFQESVRVSASSRTDTGVHALGQTVHFDIPCIPLAPTVADEKGTNAVDVGAKRQPKIDVSLLEHKMNRIIPHDMRVHGMVVAPATGTMGGLPWHARVAARGKLYRYHFTIAKHPSPLRRHVQAHYCKGKHYYYGDIDIDRLRSGAALFCGKRDFSSFANKLTAKDVESQSARALSPIRTVKRMDVYREDGGGEEDFVIDVELDGALYKMVRNLVGTLWAVGAGELDEDEVKRIFERRDRSLNPAKSAPAHGLTLVKVFYDDLK